MGFVTLRFLFCLTLDHQTVVSMVHYGKVLIIKFHFPPFRARPSLPVCRFTVFHFAPSMAPSFCTGFVRNGNEVQSIRLSTTMVVGWLGWCPPHRVWGRPPIITAVEVRRPNVHRVVSASVDYNNLLQHSRGKGSHSVSCDLHDCLIVTIV